MNDIEAAERVLAQLQDQRDRATEQVTKIEDQRQSLAYAVYAGGDEKQRAELTALNKQLADIATVIEDIDVAFVEAQQRLAAAHQAVARTDASERCKRIERSLVALAECASPLDVSWGRVEVGQAGGFIYRVGPKNPPLFEKAGTLIAEIVVELRAVRLDRGVAVADCWSRLWHRHGGRPAARS
jgi:hypothetical protein